MNLLDAAERISDFGSDRVRYRPERCLHTMVRGSDCQACWICPAEAVSETQPPLVELSKCVQCLACLPVCPTGAFSGKDSQKGILRCIHRLDARSIELLCHLHPTPEKGPAADVAICAGACLASLGSSAYLSMAAIGAERILVRVDACGDCPLGELVPQIETQIDEAGRVFRSNSERSLELIRVDQPEPSELSERQVWDAENPPLTRRDLFKMASGLGSQFISQMIDLTENGEQLGAERIRKNYALKQLFSADKLDHTTTLGDLGYASLTVDDACTACGTCARICPTGALSLQIHEGHFRLIFTPDECIACELCVSSCTPEAITINLDPTIEQVFPDGGEVNLIDGGLVDCIRCGARIAEWTTSRMCPVCEFRSLHPFGSQLPPGLERNLT